MDYQRDSVWSVFKLLAFVLALNLTIFFLFVWLVNSTFN